MGDELQLELQADSSHLSLTQLAQLDSCLHTVLEASLRQPQQRVDSMPLLTSEQQGRLRNLGRGPQIPAGSVPVHVLFERQARRTPEREAVRAGERALTYHQLNRHANRLAHDLQRRGIGPGMLVGVCMGRHVELVVGLLAVLKSGAAYVPLDPEQPPQRVQELLQQARVALVITDAEGEVSLKEWDGPRLLVNAVNKEDSNDLSLDTNPAWTGALEELAYVIFTSGSTGRPKGVRIQHHSLLNYTQALCRRLVAGWSPLNGQAEAPAQQYGLVSTIGADLGNTVLYPALISGGCVHIIDGAAVREGAALSQYSRQWGLDVLKIVPEHLRSLLAGPDSEAAGVLPRRHLVLGGDVLSPALLERIAELGADCQIYNHYGPTETTVGAVLNELGPASQAISRLSNDSDDGNDLRKELYLTIPSTIIKGIST